MAEVTKEQVVEFISNMSVLELSEMVKELEEKFGVSAAAAAVAAAPAAAGPQAEKRQRKKKRSLMSSSLPLETRRSTSSRKSAASLDSDSRKLKNLSNPVLKRSRKEFRQKKLKRSKRSLKKPELPQKLNKFVSRCGILVRGCRIDHGLRTDLAYSFPLFILVDSDDG